MSSSRNNFQFLNNPLAIRQEIQRFESVHPSIYAIYDLIELVPDQQIAQQVRDHVVCIEDSFVNSQEWTLSRSVPELRLGIVGSINSGKSALVHRYLTGSYMQEESPEGGRFKKEIFIDNQSHLLLIRDEGGLPEIQFSAWVDAVIFVFSLENEASFNAIYNFYTKMSHFRNSCEIPILLVGTQDSINEKNPRIIDEARARKLANDLKRCSYYETCATYGLNVETVFQDACQKILRYRSQNSRPTTPQAGGGVSSSMNSLPQQQYFQNNEHNLVSSPSKDFVKSIQSSLLSMNTAASDTNFQINSNFTLPHRYHALSASSHHIPLRSSASPSKNWNMTKPQQSCDRMSAPVAALNSLQISNNNAKDIKDLPTPSSTPTTSRKSNRRRSNLFIPSSKKSEAKLSELEALGVGRAIPIKQGYLYKRSSNTLNKEWKKKYVTLTDIGRLTYHGSLHDYMDDIHGKEIALNCVCVKLPGQKPRGSKSILTNSTLSSSVNFYWKATNSAISDSIAGLTLPKDRKTNEKLSLGAFDSLRDSIGKTNSHTHSGDEGVVLSNSNSQTFLSIENANNSKHNESQSSNSSNTKKRHRRMKSSGLKSGEVDDADSYEFIIVSPGKQWHFEAASCEERDEWVQVIEHEIFKTLQSNISSKSKPQTSNLATIQIIKEQVSGNGFCADCDAITPEWASLNLGILICIECSGIHRNLGSHISKVRSLDLDTIEIPHLSVMLSIGNALSNSVYEANTRNFVKPNPQSIREEKESWIRRKYEAKEFVPDIDHSIPSGRLLIEAVVRSDIRSVIITLLHIGEADVNSTVSECDLRRAIHLASAMGNLPLVQLLIWNHADVHQVDHDGRTCLSYARAALSLASTQPTNEINGLNSFDSTKTLVEMLVGLGCSDPLPITSTGTLPRKRDILRPNVFEKLSSVM
ncbi:centaurin-gamma-1A [Contarinia nasturtii]|uniref:centaurin-gamma-1A n=1 Tax=Contarinia nasturtii TaxID=265458 RepID=UPI0012D390AB|nr:centaurin-gamma-1A [Contarinia nasturtii]